MDLTFPITVTVLGMSMVFLTLGILTLVTSLVTRIVRTWGEPKKAKVKQEEIGEQKATPRKGDIALIAALDDWTTEEGKEVKYGSGYQIYLEEKPHSVRLKEKRGSDLVAEVGGRKYLLTKEKARREEQKPSPGRASGEEIIKAPLPGRAQKILAKSGCKVMRGQVLLILEALKMENDICSPVNGVVKEVLVSEDDEVEDRQELMTIEKETT